MVYNIDNLMDRLKHINLNLQLYNNYKDKMIYIQNYFQYDIYNHWDIH